MFWSAASGRSCWRPAPSVGHAVRQWGHVQLFSPWEYNIDRAAARLLASTGWNSPEPGQYPTGAELLERYLEPLATKTVLGDPHPHVEPRHRHQPCRLRQAQDQGPRKPRPSKSAIRTAKAPKSCEPMPSSTHRAPGIRQIRPAPTASAPSANSRRRTRLPTGCRMCWEKTARAMPAKPSRCWARDIPPSAPSPISQGLRHNRRKQNRSGCCGATIPQRPSAAARTTSSPPAANWAPHSPRWWRRAG